jgi:hypothetical protein
MLTTKAQRRARAKAKEVFDRELHARIDRERNTLSDAQKRQALMQSCIAEVEQENAAKRERELQPIKEYQKTLDADRERACKNARYALSCPDCAYLAENCPPFSEYTGRVEDYLGSVRNTFVNEFQPYLERTGVALTQSGLESLAALSDINTSLNWADLRTFQFVFEHLCEVGYCREGRDFNSTEQKQQEPAPKPQAREPREPQSYEELRTAAEAEYLSMAQPVWNDFQTYLMENWGVSLTTSQRHEAIETAKRLNINPCLADGWIQVKNNLVRRQVIPECRTVDERLSDFIETVNVPVNSPTGRKLIQEERNRLISEEYKKH